MTGEVQTMPEPAKRGRPIKHENQEEVIVKLPKQTLQNIDTTTKWIAENKDLVGMAIPKGACLSSKQAAKYLGMSVETLMRQHKDKIGFIKWDNLVVFDIDDLNTYKLKRRVKPVTV